MARPSDPLATSALFIAAQFLPAFLAPMLTAKVDQHPLRRVLPAIYAAEALVFVLLAVLAGSFSLVLVLALALVDGALMLTARGLSRGAVNAVLQPKGLLREGNGLLNVGFAAASVGGAALGGLLVNLFGVGTALLVDAASFAVVSAVLATCAALPRTESEPEPFLARTRAGLRYARTNRVARFLICGEGLAVVFFTLIVPIEIVYAAETLDTSDLGYGILLSSWGAGIVLGSLVFLSVRRRSVSTLILASTFAIGCAYLGMAVARDLWVACAFSIVGGLGNGDAVGVGDDGAAGVDPARPPGAHHRPARVGHLRHDRRRLPDRRDHHRDHQPADGVRRLRDRRRAARARRRRAARRAGRAGRPSTARPRRSQATPSGGA